MSKKSSANSTPVKLSSKGDEKTASPFTKTYKGDSVDSMEKRKKKKVMEMKDVRKSRYAYNEFVERKSLLD